MASSDEPSATAPLSVRIPGSLGIWVSFTVAIVLLLSGMLLFDGPMAGVLGLWGLSLLAVTVVGVFAYRLWYLYGS